MFDYFDFFDGGGAGNIRQTVTETCVMLDLFRNLYPQKVAHDKLFVSKEGKR